MSAKSDKFEKDVAEGITNMWNGLGLIAERPPASTAYSDVRLKYNGKYYDCHGSLYFTPECAEVTNIMLRDNKTGKVDTPKF